MTAEHPHPGKIWREIIVEADVTQTWVAARIGMSTKHLNQIVMGHQLPSVKHVVAFTRLMKVNPEKVYLAQARYEVQEAIEAYEEAEEIEINPSEKWS